MFFESAPGFGTYLRRLWARKPEQYDYDWAQYSVMVNAEKLGIDPAFIAGYWPFWEGAGAVYDICSAIKGVNGPSLWERNYGKFVDGPAIDTNVPVQPPANGLSILVEIHLQGTDFYEGICEARSGSGDWNTSRGFTLATQNNGTGIQFHVGTSELGSSSTTGIEDQIGQLLCTWSANGQQKIIINNELVSSQAGPSSWDDPNSHYWIATYYDHGEVSRMLSGKIKQLVILYADVSEHSAYLHAHPYYLLQPVPRTLFFDLGAAGLTFDSISQSQGMDAPSLSQLSTLSLNNIAQSQSIDALSLSQIQQLTINAIAQGQSLDSLTLDQLIVLSINGVGQSQTLDSPSLSIPGELAIDSIAQGQILDALSLSQYQGVLTLAAISQGQSLGSPALDQAHSIICNNIAQGQSIDTQALDQLISLSINAVSQGQTLDEPSFYVVSVLDIDSVAQAQSIEATSVSQVSQLIIDQVAQGQVIENVNFSVAKGRIHITITARKPGVNFNGKSPNVKFH